MTKPFLTENKPYSPGMGDLPSRPKGRSDALDLSFYFPQNSIYRDQERILGLLRYEQPTHERLIAIKHSSPGEERKKHGQSTSNNDHLQPVTCALISRLSVPKPVERESR